jgi:serine/threonine-protein kinase
MDHRVRFWFLVGTLLLSCSAAAVAAGEEPSAELAAQAGPLLTRYCARCHRGEGSESGYAFNVRDVPSLVEHSVVVAGEPDSSDLYRALFRGRMPPRNQTTLPRPTPEEVELIRRWIAAGAPEFPQIKPRTPITLTGLLQRIKQHFDAVEPRDRATVRYFTLTHLYNDPTVDERHLRMVRAALVKALNSLSWEPSLVIPQAIDPEQTVFAIDISQLGWTRAHWLALVADYPYGLSFDSHDDRALRRLDDDLRLLAGGDAQLLHLRADWFVAVGLKPRLYHQLLYELTLPSLKARRDDPQQPANPKQMTDRDLEAHLQVEVNKNLFSARPRASRAGYTESGISEQNRLIERHPIDLKRSYWKSYDFLASNRLSILNELPLGPRNDANEFNAVAFQHDGGEIIFHLPNGLQGYLLADAAGRRLDAGPIEIVGDSLKTSGNQLIVNGLSCIVCHRLGMIEPPDDEVRKFAAVFGDAQERVEQLYPPKEALRRLIDKDAETFWKPYEELAKPFLLQGEDAQASLKNLPEPVGETARRFLLESLELPTIAAELYQVDIDKLKAQLELDPVLRGTGLSVLRRDNGRIKRDVWESRAAFSLMQEVARQLGFTPR